MSTEETQVSTLAQALQSHLSLLGAGSISVPFCHQGFETSLHLANLLRQQATQPGPRSRPTAQLSVLTTMPSWLPGRCLFMCTCTPPSQPPPPPPQATVFPFLRASPSARHFQSQTPFALHDFEGPACMSLPRMALREENVRSDASAVGPWPLGPAGSKAWSLDSQSSAHFYCSIHTNYLPPSLAIA